MGNKILIESEPIFTAKELNIIDSLWKDENAIYKKTYDREYNTNMIDTPPIWITERLLKWYENVTKKEFISYECKLILHRFKKDSYFAKHQDNNFRKDGYRDTLIGININTGYEGGKFQVYKENQILEIGKIPGAPYSIDTELYHEITPVLNGVRKSLVLFIYEKNFKGNRIQKKYI